MGLPAASWPDTVKAISPCPPAGMSAVCGSMKKWQSTAGDVLLAAHCGEPLSTRTAPDINWSVETFTPLPWSCTGTCASIEPAAVCLNHCSPSVPVTPPFTVTPPGCGGASSMSSCPTPTASGRVAWPPSSTASMVKATGASEPAACTDAATVNVYVRTAPASLVVPATSADPATCSAALAVLKSGPESIAAITVTLPARRIQVDGADTLLTTGPCCTHFALRHTSPAPHFGWQGSAQTCRPGSQAAGAVHCESSLHGPAGETEHAARSAQAIQTASSELIRRMARTRTRW